MCTILFLKVNSIISYHHQGYNSHGSFIHLLLWPLSKHNHGISYPDFACAKPHPSIDIMSMNNSRPFNAEPQLQRTNKDFWLSLQNYNSKPSTVLPFIKFHPYLWFHQQALRASPSQAYKKSIFSTPIINYTDFNGALLYWPFNLAIRPMTAMITGS